MRLLAGHWSMRKMTAYSPMWGQIIVFFACAAAMTQSARRGNCAWKIETLDNAGDLPHSAAI
jgi:hypothetical protein